MTFDGATADKLLHRVAGHDERQAHRAIFAGLNAISTVRNTKADALLVAIEPKESWCVVYEYPDQARAITQNARRAEVAGFRPALPRDLEVCRSCVVTGWSSRSFARRPWAHTPRRITALVDARSASQFCERMLESSSSPSANFAVISSPSYSRSFR